ncbi:MAG: hypothetical protein IH985_00430 [Planctomycetes bacterium]|nr:hypothetical protein [Planctomycetota bacterium]
MGATIPNGRRQMLEWAEGLIARWNTNQAPVGLTSTPSAPTTVYLGVPGDEGAMSMAA